MSGSSRYGVGTADTSAAQPGAQESWIPGGGGLFSTVPGRYVGHYGLVTSALTRRLQLLLWSIGALASSAVTLTLWILTVVSIPLYGVWIGIPLSLATIWLTRRVAGLHRRVYTALFGYDLPAPYLVPERGGITGLLRTTLRDPATWRDLAWLVLDSTVGLTLAILGVVEAVLDLLFWFLPAGLSLRLTAWLGSMLLGPTETSRLAVRVGELAQSRAETVDTQAVELRRIERDLHDGAQARLVALGMTLALAEAQLADDPDDVRVLLGEARAASSTALAELRDLVRGIHPPVLADRGLAGAVEALALTVPGGVETRVDVPLRLPAPVESAAYFATAEALANAIKHSGSTHICIDMTYRDERLLISVRDDGHGGADSGAGSGLRGIERRLSAFDGSLVINSPPGGPTRLDMFLPCASSSPKISPSSGTA
jgi:signal transduction histidine kinase